MSGITHKMTEDYVNFVGDLMIPKKKFAFGYNPAKDKVNIFKYYMILIKLQTKKYYYFPPVFN